MKVTDYTQTFRGKYITERDINRLKRLFNGSAKSSLNDEQKERVKDKLYERIEKRPLVITPEQAEKGIAWLRDKYKTPRGVERVHNPFGYREADVLENFDHFDFVGFYDAGNSYFKNYMPIYDVVAKDGSTFQYYMQRGSGYNGGDVSIVG